MPQKSDSKTSVWYELVLINTLRTGQGNPARAAPLLGDAQVLRALEGDLENHRISVHLIVVVHPSKVRYTTVVG